MAGPTVLDEGTLTFSIESRIVRELGERLVTQPEVALVELIKNSYDADATLCDLKHDPPNAVEVHDNGHGMTLADFKAGWMRIGTSAKASERHSPRFGRVITGEKGIGRFAVRFLGRTLDLESVADDSARGFRTLLTAHFHWPQFDNAEDLGKVEVPYQLVRANGRSTGTTLRITELRSAAEEVDLHAVRTSSISVVTPYAPLLRKSPSKKKAGTKRKAGSRADKLADDSGFSLEIHQPEGSDEVPENVASALLDNAVLRAVVELQKGRVKLRVYRRDSKTAALSISDKYPNTVGTAYADIRFFPQRKGTFADMPVHGRVARKWVRDHSGVAVFDRTFRVLPYGTEGDDWLLLAADAAKRAREPRSNLAKKHFPMDESTRMSTQLNYMLRLPYPQQLVGIVQVEGRRSSEQADDDEGLVAAADRVDGHAKVKKSGRMS